MSIGLEDKLPLTSNHPDNHRRFSPPGSQNYNSDHSDNSMDSDATTSTSSSQTHEVPPMDAHQVLDARLMSYDYIKHQLDTSTEYDWEECIELPQPNRARLAMRELAQEFETRHRAKLVTMIEQLQLRNTTVYPTFVALTKELFDTAKDGVPTVNWGRIVTLLAFGGALAKHCVDKEMPQLINNIASWTSTFLSHQLREWIDAHGGWDGFVDFYEHRAPAAGGDGDDSWLDWRNVAKVGAAGVVLGLTGAAAVKKFA